MIGHLKTDHGMRRCWLKGSEGDALHAVLCAAGFNIRWLLRAIAQGRAKALWLALMWLASWLRRSAEEGREASLGDQGRGVPRGGMAALGRR